MTRAALALLLGSLALGGCPAASSEPPPPPRKPEIPVAPPHALGALAAGTDAAPRPYATLPGAEAEPPPAAPAAPSAAPDAGAPGAAPSPPAAPDAGMAL